MSLHFAFTYLCLLQSDYFVPLFSLAVPGLSVPQRPAGATTAPTAAPSATPAAVVTTPAPSSNASSASGLPDGNSQQQMNNFMTQMFQLMGGAGAGAGGAPPVGVGFILILLI